MREELKDVYPFIDKWVKSKGAELCTPEDVTDLIWSNDYTEYILCLNPFGMPQFIAFNIEMVRCMIFSVPIITEHQFLNLMEILA